MPIVQVKGVANPIRFPDDMDEQAILEVLRDKFSADMFDRATGVTSDVLSPVQNTVAPYEPTLAERMGSSIASTLKDTGIISDNYGAQRIGRNVSALAELLPGIGDATAGDDFGRAVAQGDKFGMAMAGLGAIPIAGDAAKKGFKRLYRGLEQDFNPNFDNFKTDAPAGYSTWTDNKDLARQYAGDKGNVYYVDLPESEMGIDMVDADGERPLFLNNEKPAALNNVSGDEYLLYMDHENYSPENIKLFEGKTPSTNKDMSVVFDTKAIKPLNQSLPMDEVKSVEQLSESIKSKKGIKTLNLYEDRKGNIKLDTIIVDKAARGSGVGSEAMEDIISYADKNNKLVKLTPAIKDDYQGTTSQARLKKFYKRFGFVENKGRNKDYTISELMYREPKSKR